MLWRQGTPPNAEDKIDNVKGSSAVQWLQDPSEINGDNVNEKREYLKYRINELATNSKNKSIRDLYRGINYFKRGYQPTNNLVKDENGDCLQIPVTF
jgi:hypothetical protein